MFDYLVYGKILVVSVHFHLNDVNSTSSSPSSSTSTVPPISTTELEFKEESKRSEPRRQELNSTATTPTSNKASPNGQLIPNWVLLILCCLALVGLFGLGILGLTCYWTIKKNLENLRTGNNKVDMEADNKATGVRKG